jgi:predicted component of viral defense system (DUF524 family)
MERKIKFFYSNERVEVPDSVDPFYLDSLHEKGKIVRNEDRVELRDFCGYLGDTLYIPKKIEDLLQLESDEDYNSLFTNLFGEVIRHFDEDILFQLFPTNIGLEKTSFGKGSLLFQLNTILKFRDSSIFALNTIIKNPHRVLVEDEVYRDYSSISYIDESVLLDTLQNPQNWYNNSPRKPIRVLQYDNFESVDTLENRFIKFFLEKLSNLLDALLIFTVDIPVQRILVRGLKSEVESFKLDFPFEKVGEMKILPYNSQVLLKRDGYRELFDLYHRLYFSFRPSFLHSMDNAISLKDISSLWEYFVFIKLIELFGEIKKESLERGLKVKNEEYERAFVEFESGAKIYYQYIFQSYSRIPFRPDFYIEYDGKKFVLDAKFRVFESNRTEILKNMHYYRDSLGLNSAVAIVIGNREGGELYLQSEEKEVVSTISEIFSRDGVGYFNIDLHGLLWGE